MADERATGGRRRSGAERAEDPIARTVDTALRLAEHFVYIFVSLLLIAASVVVLASVAYHLVVDIEKGIESSATTALDGLLLVFILLELLAGVRATMRKRELVAEPFLLVGIIALIKEIVVVALKADSAGPQQRFENSMTEIGVLGGVVVILGAASFLVRRKEREPDE